MFVLGVAAFAAPHRAARAPQDTLPDTTGITPAMVNAGRKVFHGQGTCFACTEHGRRQRVAKHRTRLRRIALARLARKSGFSTASTSSCAADTP